MTESINNLNNVSLTNDNTNKLNDDSFRYYLKKLSDFTIRNKEKIFAIFALIAITALVYCLFQYYKQQSIAKSLKIKITKNGYSMFSDPCHLAENLAKLPKNDCKELINLFNSSNNDSKYFTKILLTDQEFNKTINLLKKDDIVCLLKFFLEKKVDIKLKICQLLKMTFFNETLRLFLPNKTKKLIELFKFFANIDNDIDQHRTQFFQGFIEILNSYQPDNISILIELIIKKENIKFQDINKILFTDTAFQGILKSISKDESFKILCYIFSQKFSLPDVKNTIDYKKKIQEGLSGISPNDSEQEKINKIYDLLGIKKDQNNSNDNFQIQSIDQFEQNKNNNTSQVI